MIVGVAGGEYGIRGFIDAYDAQTGKRAWRFYTIPGPGEPGNNTWAGDSWKTRRRGRLGHRRLRSGTESALLRHRQSRSRLSQREPRGRQPVQLLAASRSTPTPASSRWHYQFTPHDVHDWDSTEVPILADITIGRTAAQGRDVRQPQRLLLHARSHQRQGDRRRSRSCTTTWAKEIGRDGRPMLLPGPHARREGRGHLSRHHRRHELLAAGLRSDARGLFFVNAREVCTTYYAWKPEYTQGDRFTGGAGAARARARTIPVYGALRAIDPATGERKWEFKYLTPVDRGPADDRVGPDLQRRRRRQPAGARLAQRQAAVAVPDGRDAARHVADHLHARRPAAPARARGHDADRVGAGAVTGKFKVQKGQSSKSKCKVQSHKVRSGHAVVVQAFRPAVAGRPSHSCRNADSGSTRRNASDRIESRGSVASQRLHRIDSRRAAHRHVAGGKAAHARSAATPRYESGSIGLRPCRRLRNTREEAMAPASPMASPARMAREWPAITRRTTAAGYDACRIARWNAISSSRSRSRRRLLNDAVTRYHLQSAGTTYPFTAMTSVRSVRLQADLVAVRPKRVRKNHEEHEAHKD